MSLQRASYPDIEIQILVGYGFHVEAYRRYRSNHLSYLHRSMSAFETPKVALGPYTFNL